MKIDHLVFSFCRDPEGTQKNLLLNRGSPFALQNYPVQEQIAVLILERSAVIYNHFIVQPPRNPGDRRRRNLLPEHGSQH